jgi:hypothetical protein
VWTIVGFLGALLVALLAFARSRTAGGFYDADVYGITAAGHRAYGFIASAFCALFLLALAMRAETLGLWLLAAFVPFALFYLTSFLRGAHEDDDDGH